MLLTVHSRCCGQVEVLVLFRGELILSELVLGYVGRDQRWRDVRVPAVEIGHLQSQEEDAVILVLPAAAAAVVRGTRSTTTSAGVNRKEAFRAQIAAGEELYGCTSTHLAARARN